MPVRSSAAWHLGPGGRMSRGRAERIDDEDVSDRQRYPHQYERQRPADPAQAA